MRCYFYAQFDTYVLIASRLLIWFITCEQNKLSNEWITKLTSIQGIFIDTPLNRDSVDIWLAIIR